MSTLTRPLLLALALLLIPPVPATVALAQEPATAVAEAPEAPLLVQSHQAFVRLQRGSARGSVTWTVAVMDPAAAQGAAAPAELEGAVSRGARIEGGRLVLPSGLQPGSVLTFEGGLELPRSPFAASGLFRTVPGHPTARAELVVRAAGAPISVWMDPSAVAEWRGTRLDELRLVWEGIETDQVAEAVWSGGSSWLEEGQALLDEVEPLLTDELGRILGQGLETITPTAAAERVFREIKLVPGDDVGWISRPARYVIDSGSGTRAERGIVLLSLLRAAGYDAQPALYRPVSLPGRVPTSLAAASLLRRPLIAVPMDDDTLWIDPGAPWVQLPGLPSELTGASAWIPGDLPRHLESSGAADGTVPISGELRMDRQGGASFSVTLTATGAADEFLRDQLGPLSDEERAQVFRPMVAAGRPAMDRLEVSVSGLESRDRPITLTVRGHTSDVAKQLVREVYNSSAPPLLAPSLARWLPPRITVHEELAMTPPPGLHLLTVVRGDQPTHPSAVVSRSVRSDVDRVVLITEVERPLRHLTPTQARVADDVLSAASVAGPEVLHVVGPSPKAPKGARLLPRDAAERVTLEAMLEWRLSRYGKARKLLDRYMDPIGLGTLDAQLVRYGAPYELRRELVDLARDNDDLLATIPVLISMGRQDEAWARAAQVAPTQVHPERVDARLWMVKLQGDTRPDAAKDPEGAARWQDPTALLQEADASARIASGGPDPRVHAARARLLLDSGDVDQALALLQVAAEASSDPDIAVALAEATARAGAPLDDVVARLDAAVVKAPSDPHVLGIVADALAHAEAWDAALDRALAAARLSDKDEAAWSRVVDRAMAAGELTVALMAARKASDLALTDAVAAATLTRVASLAGDQELAKLGWTRGGVWRIEGEQVQVDFPPDVATLIGLVDEEHLLAVLRHHDLAVVSDPALLSLRAQLELNRGDRERAVRDGTLLVERHGIARGGVVAFGAALGQVWSADSGVALDRLVRRDPAARAARVELNAVIGGDIGSDLKQMPDDPRARIWSQALSAPDAMAALDPAWTAGPPPRGGGPRGFTANPVLGSARGVSAWSNTASRQAVVRHAGSNDLPPPLSLLFTSDGPPVRSLPGGGRVIALQGGQLPLFAAVRVEGTQHILGLGYSVEDAVRALDAAPPQ